MKRLLFLLAIFSQFFTAFAFESKIDWNADVLFLRNELPKKHKNLFFKTSRSVFESKLNEIQTHLTDYSDIEVAIKLQKIIALMGDSHTVLNIDLFFKSKYEIPIRMYHFSDGIFVVKTLKDYEPLLGKKLISINGFKLQQVVDSLSTLIVVDNQAMLKKRIPVLLTSVELLNHFGFGKGNTFEIEYVNDDGSIFKINLTGIQKDNSDEYISIKPAVVAQYVKKKKQAFSSEYIANKAIYYIQYNKCIGKEYFTMIGDSISASKFPSFDEFHTKVISTLTENSAIDKLIFDIRFNSGGNSSQGTALIKDIAKIKNINKRGKIYVIIGRETFSSAIINAMDFRNETYAILVGEETSGKPNHFGEIKSFTLPNSRIQTFFSTKFFERDKSNPNTILPDVKIESTFSDYKNGIDPVLEWILKQ